MVNETDRKSLGGEANKKAWAFFETQPPWYQRAVRYAVMSAKNEATRLRRLEALIDRSATGTR